MPADILTFADEVVAILQGQFDAAGADVTAVRAYAIDFDIATFTGMQVVVMPVEYARASQATRAEDYFDAGVVIVVAQRYTGTAATPPTDWLDNQVNLVESCVFDPLRKIGESDEGTLILDAYWATSVEVTTVYDAPFLREHQAFWSEIEVTFRKLRDAAT